MKDIQGQLQRWGIVVRDYFVLVSDGQAGHCLRVLGIARRTHDFVYWDPWPVGSFLESGKNAAGVGAIQVPNGERFWLVSPQQLQRVIYAFFLPLAEWEGKMGLPRSSSTALAPPSEKIVRPDNATQRVKDLLLFCRDHDLLTERGINDLMILNDNGTLFSCTADGYMTIDGIEKMAINSFLQKAS